MNILFITSNRIGDAVLSTGILAALTARYPDGRLTIACGPFGADLFRATPNLEALIILKKKTWNRHWIGLWRECAAKHWDLIVDIRNSIVSRLLHAKKRCYHTGKGGIHKVIEHGNILGLNPPPSPHIWLDATAEKEAERLLPDARPLIALGPAANWPCKQWPAESFAALVQKLTRLDGSFPDAPVLILADAREREQIAPLLQSIPDNRRIEVIGHNLLTAAACLRQCALFVGNDSGLMHIAAAVGIPTLGLFGPGYEEIYGPWGARCAFVRTIESREELLARLPYQGAHAPNLMQGLSVDAAYEAVQKLISAHAPAPMMGQAPRR